MAEFKLPYGKSYLNVHIPDERINSFIHNKIDEIIPVKSESELVLESVLNPIGGKRLFELAKGKNNVVIIASDHTRPVVVDPLAAKPFPVVQLHLQDGRFVHPRRFILGLQPFPFLIEFALFAPIMKTHDVPPFQSVRV